MNSDELLSLFSAYASCDWIIAHAKRLKTRWLGFKLKWLLRRAYILETKGRGNLPLEEKSFDIATKMVQSLSAFPNWREITRLLFVHQNLSIAFGKMAISKEDRIGSQF